MVSLVSNSSPYSAARDAIKVCAFAISACEIPADAARTARSGANVGAGVGVKSGRSVTVGISSREKRLQALKKLIVKKITSRKLNGFFM